MTIKLPEPHNYAGQFEVEPVYGYTADQLKQYARDVLDEAAKRCEEQSKNCLVMQENSDELNDVIMRHHSLAHDVSAEIIRTLKEQL